MNLKQHTNDRWLRPTNGRKGLAYAQKLPPGETGPYLVIQADNRGLRVELRERYRLEKALCSLRTRRMKLIALPSNNAFRDAHGIAGILNEYHNTVEKLLSTKATTVDEDLQQATEELERELARVRQSYEEEKMRAEESEVKLNNLRDEHRRCLEDMQATLRGATASCDQIQKTLNYTGPPTVARQEAAVACDEDAHRSGGYDNTSKAAQKADGQIADIDAIEDAGERFLAWLKQSIEKKSVPINTSEARIHVLPEGLALVSPRIFREFDLANWSRAQRRFQKLKLHRNTPQGTNIWTCQIQGSRKRSILKVLLIPDPVTTLGVTVPNVNPAVQLLTTEPFSL